MPARDRMLLLPRQLSRLLAKFPDGLHNDVTSHARHQACIATAAQQANPVEGVQPTTQASNARTFNSWMWYGAMSLAMLPIAVSYADSTSNENSAKSAMGGLLSLEQRRRIFFKYEKRIRENSTAGKVFDYFSSAVHEGAKYMTALDLLAAVVPSYPPSQSDIYRMGSLDGEPAPRSDNDAQPALKRASDSVFSQFDVDGDGRISFWEYKLVLTLLAIPQEDVETIFNVLDLDGSGSIDAGEFHEMISQLQGKHSSRSSDRLGRQGLAPSSQPPSGILLSFFGSNQEGKLKLQQFKTFLSQLHQDIVQLEFLHYDVHNKGSVPGIDFARSLVAAADVRVIDQMLDKVDKLPDELKSAAISQSDFCGASNLAHHRRGLEVALQFCVQVGRPVTRQDFEKLLTKVSSVELSSVMPAMRTLALVAFVTPHMPHRITRTALSTLTALDIIMFLFSDAHGNLDAPSFCRMMARRAKLWSNKKLFKDNDDESSRSLSWIWSCIKQCVI